jgi:YHS domain-containing protein
MKIVKLIGSLTLLAGLLSVSAPLRADDSKPDAKLIPYTLKTCPVSGDKLGGDMGAPFVYQYKGREIKFCCKDCLKDFNKDPEKYIKKIEKAEAKAAKEAKPGN